MMDNVSNIKALDYPIYLIGQHAAGNLFALGGKLMDNVTCNLNLVIISRFLIT